MPAHEILLLGDGSHLIRTIGWVLDYKGYIARVADSPEVALEALVKRNYDLVIAGPTTKAWDGLEVLKRARKLNPGVKIMLLSGNHETTFPLEAYELEADDYLVMPVSPTELWRRVSRCLERQEVLELKAIPVAAARRGGPADEKKGNRLMSMVHDIRGSLVSTAAELKLLARGTHSGLAESAQQKIGELSRRLEKSLHLTEEFLAQIMAGPDLGEREVLNLHQDIVEPVLAELAEEIEDQQIKLDNRLSYHSQELLPVKGSRLWLKSVFRNLVTNGMKYGGRGCTIAIDLEQQGLSYRLNVYNSGSVIPEEYRSLLFSQYCAYPRKDRGARQGLGMGLSLSRDIIKSYGGDIWYEPRQDGSNFVVSLPQN